MPDRDERGRWLVGHAQPGPGRPPLLTDAHIRRAYQLALAGKTDTDIADLFKISRETFYQWVTHSDAFSDALSNGREFADGEAAASAHTAINGGIIREQKTYKDAQGNILKVVETVREVPPDAGAAMKWLEHRQRGMWAREAMKTPDAPGAITDMTEEQIEAELAALRKRRET